jgi:hypothetical protein
VVEQPLHERNWPRAGWPYPQCYFLLYLVVVVNLTWPGSEDRSSRSYKNPTEARFVAKLCLEISRWRHGNPDGSRVKVQLDVGPVQRAGWLQVTYGGVRFGWCVCAVGM